MGDDPDGVGAVSHGRREVGTPWVDEEGFTSVPGFLAAYRTDDNAFWRAEIGDIQNVLDAVVDMLGTVHPEHPQPEICEACVFLGRVDAADFVPMPGQ